MLKSISMHPVIFHCFRKILCSWVRTTVQNNNLESLNIDSNKPVCYVFRNRSFSDLLLLENECIKASLPSPSQSITSTLGDHSFLYLSQQEGLVFQRERPDSSSGLARLLQYVKQNPDQNIQLIPVSIFWGRTADKEQSALKLLFDWNFSMGGRLRKLFATLLHGRNTLVHFNPALSLCNIANDDHDHTHTLKKIDRILRIHFSQQRTSVLGPDLSHRRMLVNSLIQSSTIKNAIKEEASTHSISLEKAEYKAKKYAKEIVSDFSFSAIRLMEIILTWFWNKLYSGVNVSNISHLKELAKTSSIIYIPCHRSHIDYLLLSYVLYHHGLTPPHTAAGINLKMPFIGTILRKCGAFFMRRTFNGNPLYSCVFYEYMYTLSCKGFPIEYFIEGGRSRTGRTLSPKTGMLSISLRNYLRNGHKPVSFIPIYIGYEKLLEVNTYLGELRGKTKKKESPLDIFRTLAALKNNLGKAWINFGEPISLANHLDTQIPHWRKTTTSANLKPDWLKEATNSLAIKIVSRINSAAIINPVNLVSMALLSTPRHALGKQELLLQLNAYLKLLPRMSHNNTIIMTDLDSLSIIRYVQKLKLISRQTDSLGEIFYLEESTAIQMTYYRNNILHIFAIPSLISCLFVNINAIKRKEVMRICSLLYPYLKSELFIEWNPREFLKIVDQCLKVMVNENMIKVDRSGIYCQPDTTSTHFFILTVLSKAIIQTLERFYITITILIKSGSDTIEQSALEKRARYIAQRLSIIHGWNAPEFFDKALFSGFIQQLRKNRVIHIAQTNKIVFSDQVKQVADEAFKVLSIETRHNILQTTDSAVYPHPLEE
ncbi:MAG: glycerol-3-phosphate 1-O-acyltransferase PlsB [Candidatus Endonucleobacter sp. (ex Gigantidas childressi)]|nr:glycerol-3-phosphate 1-O-acyltransferase PlsB [Candidatus Endonucleobacter sp. (ex Gigantidas childressi)]